MYLGVAIRTAVEEQPLPVRNSLRCIPHMPAMALQTEERHCGIEQVIVDRAMGCVTVGAVLVHIAMLVCKRPLLLHMASGACLLRGISLQELVLGGAVWFMAVDAGHFLLPQGVMGKEIVLGLYFGMATETEFRHLLAAHLLLRPLVQLVAIKSAHVV